MGLCRLAAHQGRCERWRKRAWCPRERWWHQTQGRPGEWGLDTLRTAHPEYRRCVWNVRGACWPSQASPKENNFQKLTTWEAWQEQLLPARSHPQRPREAQQWRARQAQQDTTAPATRRLPESRGQHLTPEIWALGQRPPSSGSLGPGPGHPSVLGHQDLKAMIQGSPCCQGNLLSSSSWGLFPGSPAPRWSGGSGGQAGEGTGSSLPGWQAQHQSCRGPKTAGQAWLLAGHRTPVCLQRSWQISVLG